MYVTVPDPNWMVLGGIGWCDIYEKMGGCTRWWLQTLSRIGWTDVT